MIPGVTEYEVTQITTLNIKLDRTIAKHEYCKLLIDEKEQRITIVLWNNTYTYTWSAKNFIPFLIRTFTQDPDYLYDKLADHVRYTNLIDTEETVKKMCSVLLKARRNQKISEMTAAEIWKQFENIHDEDISAEHFYDIFFDRFKLAIETHVYSDEPWYEDFITYSKDTNCHHFCHVIAPIIAKVIEDAYQGRGKSHDTQIL